jgi:uncharacterized protein YvpB
LPAEYFQYMADAPQRVGEHFMKWAHKLAISIYLTMATAAGTTISVLTVSHHMHAGDWMAFAKSVWRKVMPMDVVPTDASIRSLAAPAPPAAHLTVPGFRQFPSYPNGCEAIAMVMLLRANGVPVTPDEVVRNMPLDTSPRVTDRAGHIISWGNPEVGFVGDISGRGPGMGVYHTPVAQELRTFHVQPADLTGQSFDRLLESVAHGEPVIVWVTLNMQPAHLDMVWTSARGKVAMTRQEHTVLLVGYDRFHVYVNDPWNGQTAIPLDRGQFELVWKSMGSQAVTVRPAPVAPSSRHR